MISSSKIEVNRKLRNTPSESPALMSIWLIKTYKKTTLFLAPIGETELSHEYLLNSHRGLCERGRIRDHSIITSAKKLVGGVRKWQFYADIYRWVGLKNPKTCWRNTWMVCNGVWDFDIGKENPLKVVPDLWFFKPCSLTSTRAGPHSEINM